VDDLGHGGAGLGVALVVGELQITDHRAVSVAPSCLTYIHTYNIARSTCSCQGGVCLHVLVLQSRRKRSEQGKRHRGGLHMPTNSGSPVRGLFCGTSGDISCGTPDHLLP